MSSTQFEKFTPDREALIPVIRDNWRATALSTERLNRQQAEKAVKAAYALIGMEEPEILFFDSPYGAFIKSAREAICWVNWGAAPEDFAVQT